MKNITISNGWFAEEGKEQVKKVICQHPNKVNLGDKLHCGFCGALGTYDEKYKLSWKMPEYFVKRGLDG